MENVCQANIITKNGESIDTDKLPLLQSKEMHDCDNVDARRKLLDAYLYENDELHNCGTDIPSTLGIPYCFLSSPLHFVNLMGQFIKVPMT